ncbi:adenylosuccinate synthetase [Dongia sp. agr-C8]
MLDDTTSVVIDNIRKAKQLQHFRHRHDLDVIHAHLWAERNELESRFKEVNERKGRVESYTDADLIKDENDIIAFKRDADVRIYTTHTDSSDTLVRVAARLGLYSPPDVRCVDVIVGGQFGSEGKGHVAAYLARDYDVLVRVGGPNAGHTVSSGSGVFTYVHLPSGARDTNAKLLLGPGSTINIKVLLKEISDCAISQDRLYIDPQAMVISDEDIETERELVTSISSTGQGSGAAAARRILGRKPGLVKLARDFPELACYVGDKPPYKGATRDQLEDAYRRGHSILLEGTQGSGLSIFHGQYPHVTSRDTNVAGCLAEAGISPSRVRRILMVVRPQPIRVGNPPDNPENTSGKLKHEVGFREIARIAEIDPEEVVAYEKGSRSGKPRRVGWFEWDQFRDACALNAPTDIVLTFADYISGQNANARRFEQLTVTTIKFIEELERVAQAPVSLINTRFPREGSKIDLRSVIDRRNWGVSRRAVSASLEK